MKIEIYISVDSDENERQRMLIDGKNSYTVRPLCECPEDAIIGRGLISCEEIAAAMRRAWAAGVAGESFTVKCMDEEE